MLVIPAKYHELLHKVHCGSEERDCQCWASAPANSKDFCDRVERQGVGRTGQRKGMEMAAASATEF